MSNCDFCDTPLKNDGQIFTRADMLNLMSKFPTMGDFTKHYGFSNTILVNLYMKFNQENADSITLCPDCSGKLSSK
jgi:hypothetical protein